MAHHLAFFPTIADSAVAVAVPASGIYLDRLPLSEKLTGTCSIKAGTESRDHPFEKLVFEAPAGNRDIDADSDKVD